MLRTLIAWLVFAAVFVWVFRTQPPMRGWRGGLGPFLQATLVAMLAWIAAGCFLCINCSKGDLALVDEVFPEQLERLEAWKRLASKHRSSATPHSSLW